MVGNTHHPYSKAWDSLLNLILEKGEIVNAGNPIATFKLKVKKKGWLGISYTKDVFYEIWVAEPVKTTHYATLWSAGGVLNSHKFKPSQEVMDRLDEVIYAARNNSMFELPEVVE